MKKFIFSKISKSLLILLFSNICFAKTQNTQIYQKIKAYITAIKNKTLQETSKLEDLLITMKKYKTTNSSFHAGDLYEHSIWVTKAINKWFDEKDSWVEGLNENDKKIAILAGFLHDIGKAGDLQYEFDTKPSHDITGETYVLGQNTFYIDEKKKFNFTKLFENIGLTQDDIKIIAIIIGTHHELGETLKHIDSYDLSNPKSTKTSQYIQLFINRIKAIAKAANYTKPIDSKLIRLIILISAADVKGSKRIDSSKPINIYGLEIKENPAESHSGTPDNFSKFDYENKGKKIKNKILESNKI